MPLLSKYLTAQRVVSLRSRSKEGAIRELANALARTARGLDPEQVVGAIRDREKIVSSWIGQLATREALNEYRTMIAIGM